MTRRDAIVDYIAEHWRDRGFAPSIRDIADGMGCTTSSVTYHLHALKQAGVIDFEERTARTVRVK